MAVVYFLTLRLRAEGLVWGFAVAVSGIRLRSRPGGERLLCVFYVDGQMWLREELTDSTLTGQTMGAELVEVVPERVCGLCRT